MEIKSRTRIAGKLNLKCLSLCLLIVILSVSYVSAYKRLCLTYGQSIPNETDPIWTCYHDSCHICVTDNNYPARPSRCYDITGCDSLGDVEPDLDPPEIIVDSPDDGDVFNSRYVLFDIESDEPAEISYSDDNGESWRRMVRSSNSYHRELSFHEGENNIIIKARDRNGNEAHVERTFYVDSKSPRISRTYPQGGFVGSVFTIEYNEDNVEEIRLNYGVEGDYQMAVLDDCHSGKKESCSVDVGLLEYDGQEIEYWFELEDIAGNIVESKAINVFVDESEPKITNFEYEIDGRKVNFEVEVDEAFLDEIGYSYVDSRGREIEKRLCSRLNGNVCEGTVSFSEGENEVIIYALDKAGNRDEEEISFFIDTKKPKISRTEPRKCFASGIFEVEFDEANPEELVLNYGNDETGWRDADAELGECVEGRRGYSCSVEVDLDDYNEENIEYWFELTDRIGQEDESKVVEVEVDTDFPDLLNDNVIGGEEDSFWEQGEGRYNKYIYFDLQIDEENFDEVSYSYEDDRGRLRERRLCSRLRNGKCEKRVGFRDGHYELDVQIMDEAGNAVSRRIEFDVA